MWTDEVLAARQKGLVGIKSAEDEGWIELYRLARLGLALEQLKETALLRGELVSDHDPIVDLVLYHPAWRKP